MQGGMHATSTEFLDVFHAFSLLVNGSHTMNVVGLHLYYC